jgi:hypothetical protein
VVNTTIGRLVEIRQSDRGPDEGTNRASRCGLERLDDTDGRDRPPIRHGLGAVVEAYEPDALEVEFVTASGKTEALLTLNAEDVRSVGDTDLVSVRPYSRTA